MVPTQEVQLQPIESWRNLWKSKGTCSCTSKGWFNKAYHQTGDRPLKTASHTVEELRSLMNETASHVSLTKGQLLLLQALIRALISLELMSRKVFMLPNVEHLYSEKHYFKSWTFLSKQNHRMTRCIYLWIRNVLRASHTMSTWLPEQTNSSESITGA